MTRLERSERAFVQLLPLKLTNKAYAMHYNENNCKAQVGENTRVLAGNCFKEPCHRAFCHVRSMCLHK
jgi:hypothetical protein